jgi:hypothetical protein
MVVLRSRTIEKGFCYLLIHSCVTCAPFVRPFLGEMAAGVVVGWAVGSGI